MRKTLILLIVAIGLFSSRFTAPCQAQPQVTLAWNPLNNEYLAGYYLAWGTNSGTYFATNTYNATTTNGTIYNLSYGVQYYMAVAAFATNGEIKPVGPFSTEVMFMSNAPSALITSENSGPGGPPLPPLPSITRPGGNKSNASPQGNASNGSGSSSGPVAGGSSTNITQALIWGIPPILTLAMSNSQPYLSIGGTVGATYNVQSSTNPLLASSWTTITNVVMTNIAQMDTNTVPGQVQDAIDLAYVPGVQTVALPNTGATMEHFRVVMPYDYDILASIVLPAKGYTTRLILVNMPGLTDDGCYISQAGSFIHYNQTNSVMQLEGSGSTIRQIATTLANNLNMDWTTASEFTYSNGMGQILATVVEADPASSDPVAGTTPTSSIVINF